MISRLISSTPTPTNGTTYAGPVTITTTTVLRAAAFLAGFGPSLVESRREKNLVEVQIKQLGVKAASIQAPAETLSGGNQQKLVIGKWLARDPQALILDEPTRGVDVGAKEQVHRLIRQLAEQGLATLLISSDLPELLALSDRILVLCEGRIGGELDGPTATQEQILELALPDRRVAAVP